LGRANKRAIKATGYSQDWLRGDEVSERDQAHPHEGLRLADKSGWVAVGQTISENPGRVLVRRVDNEGTTVWSALFGADVGNERKEKFSVGFSVAQDPTNPERLYIGAGIWNDDDNHMKPAVLALETSTGKLIWSWISTDSSKHGGVRGVIVDGERIICTGYVHSPEGGFLFVADDAQAAVWELDKSGNMVSEMNMGSDMMPQGAKIRKDLSSGYVVSSTAWDEIHGEEVNVIAVAKLTNDLEVEWSKKFGLAGGNTQMFDILVDNDGNYLMGGHTTAGDNVKNWDYVALKVSPSGDQIFRKTFGQPRGFDARYIHDECYSVQLDPSGNYLLMGGSGDEYSYSETNPDGWQSDIWVSYLVVLDTEGSTLYEGVFGDKESNNAGEYLSVDYDSGELMVYVDSDFVGGGFAFLKLSPNAKGMYY